MSDKLVPDYDGYRVLIKREVILIASIDGKEKALAYLTRKQARELAQAILTALDEEVE